MLAPMSTETYRIPLTEFLRDETFAPFDPRARPRGAWGLFETVNATGETGWVERMTPETEIEEIFVLTSGYLGDMARHDVWLEDDEALPLGDETARETAPPKVALDERFEHLRFFNLDPGLRLTGRHLFLLLLETDGEDCICFDSGLSSYEAEGLLRVAQLRFTEDLSWSDPAPFTIVAAPTLPHATFGSLFPKWEFPALEEGVTLTSAWALVFVEDESGGTEWVQRQTEPLEVHRLIGYLTWHLAHVEAYAVARWDDPEDRPAFPEPLRSGLGEEDAPDDPDGTDATSRDDEYDPTRRAGPLDPRVAALECLSLAPEDTAARTLLVGLGTDADGDPHVYLAYAARPSVDASTDIISEIEEIGLIRSCLRDLIDLQR